MYFDWKKMALVAVGSMATSLHAIPPEPCEPQADAVCCVEPIPGPFAFAYPYDLGLNCPRDFYVHIDGLALQAKQGGMDFAIEDTAISGISTPAINGGDVVGFSDETSDWDYNPGARFGFGFYLDHDAWNLDFNWTWVNVTNYVHKKASGEGSVFIPLWLLGSDTPLNMLGNNVNAVWDAKYNVLDLSLGKPYHVSRYLVLSPFFGIRGGWIDQHFSVDYEGAIPGVTNTVHHGDKNNFRGIGARVGLDSNWIIGKGWWLFGNLSASLLAGKFDIHQKMTLPTGGGGAGFDIESAFYQNVPNTELAIGIAWSHFFDCHRYRVSLRAAYEFIQWWDQLNFRRFYSGDHGYANDIVSRGDLTLNGFSLRLQIDI